MHTFRFAYFLILLFFVSCGIAQRPEIQIEYTSLTTNTNASLRGLHVVDEHVIWASGAEGTVLRSIDGGESWTVNKIEKAPENDFRSIYAWDDKKAIVFGVAGPDFAYKTIDGGANWEVVFKDSTHALFFNSLKFADKKNGLSVSDPVDGKFFVLRTKDGGLTWERLYALPEVKEGEANFAASNTCIEYLSSGEAWIASGGMAARVFYTKDFGETWEVVNTPIIRGMSASGIFSIAFKNRLEGIIVGGIYDQPEINTNIAAYTIDGGKTWLPSLKMPAAYRSCIQPVREGSKSFDFAIGKTGCDISFDKGMNWEYVNDKGYYTFRPVPGKLMGYAAGANGEITRLVFSED